MMWKVASHAVALTMCTLAYAVDAPPEVADDHAPVLQPCAKYRSVIATYLRLPQLVEENESNGIVDEVCKTLPNRNHVTAVAYGYVLHGADLRDKRLVFALVDDRSLRVIGGYTQFVGEDAEIEIGPDSLHIDTARYRLADDVRAIGLRFSSAARGASCADGAAWSWLILFVQKGRRLDPVLDMPLSRQVASSGCIGTATDHDAGEIAKLTVGIAKARHHGYADLRITAQVEPYRYEADEPAEGEAAEVQRPSLQSYVLRFDGTRYVADANFPWWASPWTSGLGDGDKP